ncbi:MAG: patatin-like phospholipase [Harvfovirus sp.]|uniref:Patatin-like phospholipase n=1 Tax=Harvfovirus sp. TaxID=2487768 RepID=A0A3G5A3X1_9VIRU|nr:MAG: patatin-like phospholipase [Harvfovirus sp.]
MAINEESLQQELTELFNTNDNEEKFDEKFNMTTKKTKLILSGGGVKGFAHLGALKALHELNLLNDIDTYIGTSIGAFIACLLSIGYLPAELFEIISGIDLQKMKRVKLDNLLKLFGLDDGSGTQIILEKMFSAKNISSNITFQQLYEITKKKLIVTASCLNDKKAYYYSHDSFPDAPVILAVRMSMALPLYFAPVKYKNKTFVDGGCIDNYPIQLFNNCLEQVIGIYLTDVRDTVNEINNIEDMLIQITECLFEGIAVNSLKGFEKYSIKISLGQISIIDFQINQTAKQKLFDVGYKAVIQRCNG